MQTPPQLCPVQCFVHLDAAWVHESHEWLNQPLVYGVVCFCRLISVQPKLKLTCFLHALWSSVNVSWAAARVSRFSRRDYTQGSSGYRVGVKQAAVCFFPLLMTNVPSGSRDQVEDQIRLCGGLLPFNICPAAWLFSHYSEIKSPQNASVNVLKLIKNSSTIVESRLEILTRLEILKILTNNLSFSFLCTRVCVLATKWGPEYTFH